MLVIVKWELLPKLHSPKMKHDGKYCAVNGKPQSDGQVQKELIIYIWTFPVM